MVGLCRRGWVFCLLYGCDTPSRGDIWWVYPWDLEADPKREFMDVLISQMFSAFNHIRKSPRKLLLQLLSFSFFFFFFFFRVPPTAYGGS